VCKIQEEWKQGVLESQHAQAISGSPRTLRNDSRHAILLLVFLFEMNALQRNRIDSAAAAEMERGKL
jgi:hypothetical protein